MTVSASYAKSANIGGKQFSRNAQLAGDQQVVIEDSVPAALPGSLTTRTNNTDGTVTVTGTNTIITGNRLDLYWLGGQRRGCVVGTVAGQAVPITGGAGDNLPVATTAVQAAVPGKYPITLTYTKLVFLGLVGDAYGQYTFVQSDSTTEVSSKVLAASTPFLAAPGEGDTNPFAANTGFVYLSHKDTTAAKTMGVGALADN